MLNVLLLISDIIFLCLKMIHFYIILTQLIIATKKVTLRILLKRC